MMSRKQHAMGGREKRQEGGRKEGRERGKERRREERINNTKDV